MIKISWSDNSRQQSDWSMKCCMTTGKHPSPILLIPVSSTTSSNSQTNTPLKFSMTGTSTREMPWSYPYETPNVPHNSASSSSARYSPSYHFVGHYITPKSFTDAITQWDHLASAVALLQGDPVSFAEFVLLDYLCHDLRKIRQNLLDQEHIAQQQLIRFFQWRSTEQLYDWMLNRRYAHRQVILGSDHTPPDSTTSSFSRFSQSRPLPIPPQISRTPPIHIQTSPTVTEARQRQWRREFLEEEFPEEPLEGTRENPIIIEWTSFENWINDSIT